MYFLTTAAGVNPAAAGAIMMIATLIDAVAAPVIGHLSDDCMSAFGRRRPFILAGGLTLSITVVLLFTTVPIEGTAKLVYYMVFTILLWVSYSTWYIPYTAFGAEIAVDYDSRTKLRVPAAIFNGLGNLLGMSAPMLILAALMEGGMSLSGAWTGIAAIIGCVVLVTILLTWMMTRGKELRPSDEELREQKKQGFLSTYLKVLRLKPYKFLILSCISFMATYTLVMTDMLYYVTCVMQVSEAVQSQATMVFIFAIIILTPVISSVAIKIGKKQTVAICFTISAFFMILFRFTGVDSAVMLDLYLFLFAIGNSAYWTLAIAIAYDMSEVYEVKYGEQREGAVQSLNLFFIKVSAAIFSGVMGSVLAFSGYDAARDVQTEAAVAGISNLFTIIPAAFLLIAALIMLRFPLTKKKHEMLIQMIDNGECNGEVPEELKDIL